MKLCLKPCFLGGLFLFHWPLVFCRYKKPMDKINAFTSASSTAFNTSSATPYATSCATSCPTSNANFKKKKRRPHR